jgi:hypothetical protein
LRGDSAARRRPKPLIDDVVSQIDLVYEITAEGVYKPVLQFKVA